VTNRALAILVAAAMHGAAAIALTGCGAPIHKAARNNDSVAIREIAAAGGDLDAYNDPIDKWTALEMAAVGGHKEAVVALLEAGARPALGRHDVDVGARHPEMISLIASYAAKSAAGAAPSRAPGNLDAAAYDRMRAAANLPPEKLAPSSDIDSPKAHGVARPDDFALVIGIEEYQSLPKADYGARDARTVRKHFEAIGVPARNIISLEGSQATGSKMKSYLQQWLPRNVKPESTVFVYYSGHGAPDPENGDAYLVPWDADPMFLTTSAYPLKQFYAELAKLKAERVVVALDACFSGSGGRSVLAKGARPLVSKVDESVPSSANLTVLAAASGSEITGTLDDQAHGIFTYYFLKGLSGGAKTPRALYDYLKPHVQDDARRQNREQSPTLAGSGADAAF